MIKGKKQKKNHNISSSESDSVNEETEEESESEILTVQSDDDDVSTDVEELSDESLENDDDDNDDDGDDDDDDDEDLNEQTQDILGKKRKRSNKKGLLVDNEINNHAVYEGASLMSYQILMDEDEQKQYFRNWTTEKICETRDIDFAEWQKEHSTREAYFFGPDNVSLY